MTALHPLRVLFLIDSFQMGGAERVTAALLPHFDRNEVIPLVTTLNTRKESPLIDQLQGFDRFDLRAKRLLDFTAFRVLLRLLREQNIDVIHAQLQDATLMAAAAHRQTGIPLVVTRHVLADDTSNRRRGVRSWLERRAVRGNVAKIVSVSDATTDYYRRLIGLPVDRFQTIYNGIDLERFHTISDKDAVRAKLGLPRHHPLITMVGVLRPGKGQEVLIEAARGISYMQFLLVGDGESEHRAHLEQLADGLGDRLHFLGQRMDVPDILAASDLLVLPSDSEALPTVLIEAAASSLPVIATRVGGAAEIVEDDVTGILIPPQRPDLLAEKIRWLVDHAEAAHQMGDEANRRARARFSLPAQAAALTQLYRTVTAVKR